MQLFLWAFVGACGQLPTLPSLKSGPGTNNIEAWNTECRYKVIFCHLSRSSLNLNIIERDYRQPSPFAISTIRRTNFVSRFAVRDIRTSVLWKILQFYILHALLSRKFILFAINCSIALDILSNSTWGYLFVTEW